MLWTFLKLFSWILVCENNLLDGSWCIKHVLLDEVIVATLSDELVEDSKDDGSVVKLRDTRLDNWLNLLKFKLFCLLIDWCNLGGISGASPESGIESLSSKLSVT